MVYDTSDYPNIIINLLGNNQIKNNILYVGQNFRLSQRTNFSKKK